MKLGRVVGSVWATRKSPAFEGRRMLLVQDITSDGKSGGGVSVALDTVDAGTGDTVMVATSSEAAIPFRPGLTPTDRTIVGIVERVDGPFGSRRTA